MDSPNLIIRFMRFMQAHRGRERAVKREVALAHLQLWGPTLKDRAFRDMYSRLPIVSCDQGIFIPIRPEEVAEFKVYLSKKAIPIFNRYHVVLAYCPHLSPAQGEQKELF